MQTCVGNFTPTPTLTLILPLTLPLTLTLVTISQYEFMVPGNAVDEFEEWVTGELYSALKEAQEGREVRALYLLYPLERHQVILIGIQRSVQCLYFSSQ